MSGQLAFWQQKPRYDGAEYDLSHLQPFDRKFVAATGRVIDTKIAFSYHCCTDVQGNRGLGTRVTEASRPAEVRYLCPVRWFLSLKLPSLMKSLDNKKVVRIPGYQWLHCERVPGISLQWAVFIKAMPGRPGASTMVADLRKCPIYPTIPRVPAVKPTGAPVRLGIGHFQTSVPGASPM